MAGAIYDDPNRECLGLAPAWVEGDGGSEVPPDESGGPIEPGNPLDAMTKDELLAYAQGLGISPANASMTKDELRAGIDAYESGSVG